MSELLRGVGADPRGVAVAGVRFQLHRADPPRRRRTTPVLLLHGVPETAGMWRDVVRELSRDRVVLAPDLKGLGGSEVVGPYDVPTLVQELAALVLHEVDEPVDVVGHDWGGSLALALAVIRPELARRLVVVNAPFRHIDYLHAFHIPLFALPVLPEVAFAASRGSLVRVMLRLGWAADRPVDPAAEAEYVAAYAEPARVQAMLGYYRASARPRAKSAARRALRLDGHPARERRAPQVERSLVVWGARDPVLPIAVGESVVRDLGAETTFVTVPGAGHFAVEEAPEVVVPLLAEWLRAG